jgi:hypothetical protein
LVKKLIAGILGKKEDSPAQAGEEVPDELPPLAEDIAGSQAAPEQQEMPAAAPDELPSLETAPSDQPIHEQGSLSDLSPDQEAIPDAIKKAKLAKLKGPEGDAAPQEASSKDLPKPSDDFSVKERIKSGSEIGFFSTVLDHVRKNEPKDKLLAGDLFLRMDKYWELRKHEIKTGKQIPAEKKLEDDVVSKLEELKVLEQKWQVQKLGLEEDLRFLHERERDIQARIRELQLISNELVLYKQVKPEEYFILRNGIVLKNLHDLVDILEIIDDENFNFHVKAGKNDFAEWTRHVFKDENLANQLMKSKSRMEMIEVLENLPSSMSDRKEKVTSTSLNPRKYFWLSNGAVIRSLLELSDALKGMEDSLYGMHVDDKKNDFANWVSETLRNEALSHKLSKARNRREMISVIEAYL